MKKHGHLAQSSGLWHATEYVLNVLMIITGLFFFVAGTYASVQSIIDDVSRYTSLFIASLHSLTVYCHSM